MSLVHKLAAALLVVLLAAAGYGLWVTNPLATTPVSALKSAHPQSSSSNAMPVIDEDTARTARRLARLATTPEEQPLAEQAVQIADHELDLAFTAALAHLERHPPVLSPEAAAIQARLDDAGKRLAADNETVKKLTAQLAQAKDPEKPAIQDQLDLAQAQVTLEQDEVQEANNDLLQAGGNQHQRIELMQQEHEAAVKRAAAAPPAAPPTTLGSLKGMVAQVRQWSSLNRKRRWLAYAQGKAAESAATLTAERNQIAADLAAAREHLAELAKTPRNVRSAPAPATSAPAPKAAQVPPSQPPAAAPSPAVSPPAAGTAAAPVTLTDVTRQITSDERRLNLRDQRINARRKLADVYGQWDAVVATQQRTALHACLVSATIVLGALLLLLFAGRWLESLLARAPVDRRQMGALRSVIVVSLQIVGVVVILLVLVGLPAQLGTMIGIAGAGLTVALKDFIVAFIGWFVLMGRNGMRVGDWVEIKGVSGEVIELSMFHTVLLETGNWTDAGHPTGRRVTFTNSFAIEGHYFNFSTSGQWLWDELIVLVPYERDPHAIADAIQKEVTAATAEYMKQAEQEWRRAVRGLRQPTSTFSAQPGVAIRPAAGGVEIAVRYVTRASDRLALRARLYQYAVQLLAQPRAA